MSKQVWKYPLPFGLGMSDVFPLSLPERAPILTIQLQQGVPTLWALVDSDRASATRWFRVAGTGHPIEQTILGYAGTWQWSDLGLVFHLFEIESPEAKS